MTENGESDNVNVYYIKQKLRHLIWFASMRIGMPVKE